jgi:hypothetical protein
MINANTLRKIPETLQNFSNDTFQILINTIEENIKKSAEVGYYNFHVSTKKLKDNYYIVDNVQTMRQLIRALSIEFLNNGYDVQYETYTLDTIDYISLRIKW